MLFAYSAYVSGAEQNLGEGELVVVYRERVVLPPRSATTLINGTHLDRVPKTSPQKHAGRRH